MTIFMHTSISELDIVVAFKITHFVLNHLLMLLKLNILLFLRNSFVLFQ